MFKNEAARNAIEAILALNIDELKRPELEGINRDFANVTKKISEIISGYRTILENEDKLRITTVEENSMIQNITGIIDNVVQPIKAFSVDDNPNSSVQYNDILTNAETQYDNFLTLSRLLLAEINLQNFLPEEYKEKLSELKNIKKSTDKILKDFEEQKIASEKIIRTASGIEATSSSSSIFFTQSEEHRELADKWFNAVIAAFLILFFVFIAVFYGWGPLSKFNVNNATDYRLLINAIVFKVIILSSLYFVLHQTIKNYKINKHLYVINKHKHNALSVYPKFVLAGDDTETRAMIASQAAKSIFEQMPTGYLEGDDDPRPINPTSIINKIIDKKG